MKIIIYDGSFKTTAFINRLIQGLVNNSYEIYVIGFDATLKQPIDGVRYTELGDTKNKFKFLYSCFKWSFKSGHVLKTIGYILRGDKSSLKRLNLDVALKQIQPDIIHLQWVSNIKLFEAYLEQNKYKFILSQRGYQTNVRPFVNQQNYNYLQQYLSKFAGFHSVSKAISKEGGKIYTSDDKLDQVVYTGLDLSKFDFKSQVVKNKLMQIISVGRPHWIKGYAYAIKACHLLKQKGLDFQYTIVGAAGNEELLYLIDDLVLRDQIVLTDKLPQPKVFELMHTSDLFLLPSLEEGIANVTVEAMALGCPVISTDCGGMQELITHEEEGWIVPKRNVDAMANALINFGQLEEEHLKEIKLKARKKVEQQHSKEQMVERILELYKRVVG